ncbi:hypothetical protein Mapa_010098 [Marchantia paleacea]|nr:hypothetical protein Mapa_010098 [Marchantia paleacea]
METFQFRNRSYSLWMPWQVMDTYCWFVCFIRAMLPYRMGLVAPYKHSFSMAEGEASDPEATAKEAEHAQLQENLDKELQELNKRLEQKEAEMKSFARPDAVVLKQHFERKLVELEEEKKVLQAIIVSISVRDRHVALYVFFLRP